MVKFEQIFFPFDSKNTTHSLRILELLKVRNRIKDRQKSPKGSPHGAHCALQPPNSTSLHSICTKISSNKTLLGTRKC